jgi:hypothetical protein
MSICESSFSGATAFECALRAVDRTMHRILVAARVTALLDDKVKLHRLASQLSKIRHDMRVLVFECEDAEKLGLCDCNGEDHGTVCLRCGSSI